MKHRFTPVAMLLCALLLALGWNAGLAASARYRTHLPLAYSAPPASECAAAPGATLLLDQDTGALSAGLATDGRYIIAYVDRAHGGRAHVAAHVAASLVDLAPPPAGLAGIDFSPPGVKQGSLALVLNGPNGKNRLYFIQRKPDDTPNEGPYGIWCQEFS